MTKYLGKSVEVPIGETTINVSIHEGNTGALILAKTLPPQFIPQRKNYAAKTIWFCEEIVKRGINIFNIDTVEQLVNKFTKRFKRVAFEYLRKKLMVW